MPQTRIIQIKKQFQILIWQFIKNNPHPCIIQVADIEFNQNKNPFVHVMKGKDIFKNYYYKYSQNKQNKEIIKKISLQLVLKLQGLVFLQNFGFVQYDIKLDNFIVFQITDTEGNVHYTVKITDFDQYISQEIPNFKQIQLPVSERKQILKRNIFFHQHKQFPKKISQNYQNIIYSSSKFLQKQLVCIIVDYLNSAEHNRNNNTFKPNLVNNAYQKSKQQQYDILSKLQPPQVKKFLSLQNLTFLQTKYVNQQSNLNIGLKDDHTYYFSILQFILQQDQLKILKQYVSQVILQMNLNPQVMPLSSLKKYNQNIRLKITNIYNVTQPQPQKTQFSQTQLKQIMLLIGQCLIPNIYPKIYKKHFILKYLRIMNQYQRIKEFKIRNYFEDIAYFQCLNLYIAKIQQNISQLTKESFNLFKQIDKFIKQGKDQSFIQQKIQQTIKPILKIRNQLNSNKDNSKEKEIYTQLFLQQFYIFQWVRHRMFWLRLLDYLVDTYGLSEHYVNYFIPKKQLFSNQ